MTAFLTFTWAPRLESNGVRGQGAIAGRESPWINCFDPTCAPVTSMFWVRDRFGKSPETEAQSYAAHDQRSSIAWTIATENRGTGIRACVFRFAGTERESASAEKSLRHRAISVPET